MSIAVANWLVTATSLAESGAQTLWLWSWQTCAVLCCVWLGLKVFRVRNAALRHQIWLLGLMFVIALPLTNLLPRFSANAKPQRWRNRAIEYVTTLPRNVIDSTAIANKTIESTISPRAFNRISFSVTVFLAWFAGACFILLRLVYSLHKLRRICLDAVPGDACSLGLGSSDVDQTPLRLSTSIKSPLLYGLWQPIILLPHDFTDWTTLEERRGMLAHELAHIARRDHLTNWLLNLLNIAFYFHPLVRYAFTQIRLEREIACDDCVINAGADATSYAESVMKAAAHGLRNAAGNQLGQPAFITAKQTLERRIEMMLNPNRGQLQVARTRYVLTFAAFLLGLSWLMSPTKQAGGTVVYANSADEKMIEERIRQALSTNVVNPTLSKADFYNISSDDRRMTLDLIVIQAHGHMAPRVEAENFKIDISGNHALARFQGTFFFTRKDGKDASFSEQFIANLIRGKDGWIAYRQNNNSQTLSDLVRTVTDANMSQDTSVFEDLLTDDYIGTRPDGTLTTKAQELAEIKQRDYRIKKYELEDMQVRVNDASAVASFLGTFYLDPALPNSTLTTQYRYTVSFVKRYGLWKITAIHMSSKS